jgi:hypothetical protein
VLVWIGAEEQRVEVRGKEPGHAGIIRKWRSSLRAADFRRSPAMLAGRDAVLTM